MSADSLVVKKSERKKLQKLPTQIHLRIIETLDKIKGNPLIGAKLHGELAGYFKLRLGDYRIVYSFDAKHSIVYVVKIEHRQGIYK